MRGQELRIRLSDVWDETLAFLSREQALVAPLALAFFALPSILLNFFAPQAATQPSTPPSAVSIVELLLIALTVLAGNLSLSALVLRPGGSVGEALAHTRRRLLGAVGTVLLAGLIALVVAIVLQLIAYAFGARPGTSLTLPPGEAAVVGILFVILVVAVLVIAARLATLWAWVTDRERAGWPAIRGAFAETGPVAWRLLGLFLLFMLLLVVIQLAISLGLGTLVSASGLAGTPRALANAVVVIVSAAVMSGGSAFWTIFCACLHRRLDQPDELPTFE